jgi:hypothetical protein
VREKSNKRKCVKKVTRESAWRIRNYDVKRVDSDTKKHGDWIIHKNSFRTSQRTVCIVKTNLLMLHREVIAPAVHVQYILWCCAGSVRTAVLCCIDTRMSHVAWRVPWWPPGILACCRTPVWHFGMRSSDLTQQGDHRNCSDEGVRDVHHRASASVLRNLEIIYLFIEWAIRIQSIL